MNNTWKLSIMGAVALAASSAVMAIGCTVTTVDGTTDGGTTGDGSTADSGGGSETGAEGGGNACQAKCPIIEKTQFGLTIGFDTDDAGAPALCGPCDKSSAGKWCSAGTDRVR